MMASLHRTGTTSDAQANTSLKRELVHDKKYTSRDEARASLFEYIEAFYNRVRRHPPWGSYLRRSLNGRTTRNTLNFVSIFLGEDHTSGSPPG